LRFHRARRARRAGPGLRARAWPLELVNGIPLDPLALAPKIAALRGQVAPDLFTGFDPSTFPTSSLPALAYEAAAHRASTSTGERFSLAVRYALFEEGQDVGDLRVLDRIAMRLRAPRPTERDHEAVRRDLEEGRRRGVAGSPHFFTAAGDFFCPALDIAHADEGLTIRFDQEGYDRFLAATLT
jgi:hypothetical protein